MTETIAIVNNNTTGVLQVGQSFRSPVPELPGRVRSIAIGRPHVREIHLWRGCSVVDASMVVPLGLDTPRTEAGNATLTSNHGLDISFEPSFQSPSRDNNDLVSQMRNNRRPVDIKTPHSRAPFADRRNGAATGAKGEFTPLLKSVTKTNMSRRPSKDGKMATPAFLKQVHETSLLSPALSMENSAIYGDGASSFQGQDETPMPQMASSSANTTPLAMLPRRDGGGVLADGANMMTLREQENVRVH